MKIRYIALPLLPFLLVCLFGASGFGHNAKSDGAAQAASTLRTLFFTRDFAAGFSEGQKLMQHYPDDIAVKVWFIVNASFDDRADEVLELAEKMRAADEKNGWNWFALA